jgi:predicted fused transcriptional regulator/phosphomethylpyrimidine kinase
MDEQRLDKAKADGSNPFPTTKHTTKYTMTLSDLEELIEKAGNIEITKEHIAAMEKRLQEAKAEYVKEMKEKTPSWDWYHQIVG